MILPRTVFFPQAILPLHIFEPRYRAMLADVLATNQLFIVACKNETAGCATDEIPHQIATVGIVRAAEKAEDGTSNLVLQGLQRVSILEVEHMEPYPLFNVKPILTPEISRAEFLKASKTTIANILHTEPSLTNGVPEEFVDFLCALDELEAFIDLLAFCACSCHELKQKLLATPAVEDRYLTLLNHLTKEHSRCCFERDIDKHHGDVDKWLN